MLKNILIFIKSFFLKNILKFNTITLIFLSSFFLLFACKKEGSDIGLSIYQGENVNVKHYAFSIENVRSYYKDSITTDERSQILLGSYVDQYFGQIKSAFAIQFLLASFNPDFGNNPVSDSVKLRLKCVGYYGPDTTIQQTFKVYKLIGPLHVDTSYFSNTDMSTLADLSNPITEYTVSFNPNSGYLEIPLPLEIGDQLLSDTSIFSSNEDFIGSFPGFFVDVEQVASGGAVYYFSPLLEDGVVMTVYFKNDDLDSLSYSFYVTQKSAYFNLFSHDFSGTEVESYINDTIAGQYCYVQSGAGVLTLIDINDVMVFADSMPVGINKAELVVDVDTGKINGLEPPERLLLEIKDEDNIFNAPVDYFMNDYYFNGFYDKTLGKYKFVITQYIQELVKGENLSTKLIVFPQSNKTTVNRVILKNNFTLHIYYTNYQLN